MDTEEYGNGGERSEFFLIAFHRKNWNSGFWIPIYLSILDGIIEIFVFLVNIIILLYYSLVCSFYGPMQDWSLVYVWIVQIIAFVWIVVVPLVAVGKFYLLFRASRDKNILWKIFWMFFYFVSSLFFDLIMAILMFGGPTGAGLSLAIEVAGKMSRYLLPILCFVALLLTTLLFLVAILYNVLCLIVVCVVAVYMVVTKFEKFKKSFGFLGFLKNFG